MVPIRKTRAKASDDYGPDPSLDLPGGAHLGIKTARVFPPKFHEDTGDLWISKVSMKLAVIDDRTEDGEADGLEFVDYFELKIDENLGFDDKKLENANIRDFTKVEQEALLDQRNWTIRGNTKLDKLLSALYGVSWTRFDEDDLVGKEFIAKLHPRTGKRPGSYCGWDSFMSLESPKKKRRSGPTLMGGHGETKEVQQKIDQENEEALSEAEEKAMNEAMG